MAYQPFNFITPFLGQSGSISSTTLFTAPTSAYYVISVYMSPASAIALSLATMTLTFTEGGITRSITLPGLSLASLTVAVPNYINIRADAGTAVNFSVAAVGLGTYNVHVGYKQQGS